MVLKIKERDFWMYVAGFTAGILAVTPTMGMIVGYHLAWWYSQ